MTVHRCEVCHANVEVATAAQNRPELQECVCCGFVMPERGGWYRYKAMMSTPLYCFYCQHRRGEKYQKPVQRIFHFVIRAKEKQEKA